MLRYECRPRWTQLRSANGMPAAIPVIPLWLRSHRVVLVDEASEHVVTMDSERRGSGGISTRWYLEMDATMRALLVVMRDVLPKHSLEMSTTEDEDLVEAFCPNSPHPTFHVGISPGRSNRSPDDPDAFGSKHLVEAGRQLGVPIPDEELDGVGAENLIRRLLPGFLRCGPRSESPGKADAFEVVGTHRL